MRRLILPLLLLVAATGMLWLIGSSPTFQQCVEDGKSQDQTQTLQESIPGLGTPTVLLRQCLSDFLEENGSAISTLATLLIACFTVVLWWSTHNLWKAARQDFIATHRPRIIVRTIEEPATYGEGEEFTVTAVNIGSSSAQIIAFGADMARQDNEGHWVGNFNASAGPVAPPITLTPGESYELRRAPTSAYTEDDLLGTIKKETKLIVLGSLRYRDGNGVYRETGFFRVQSKKPSESFIPSDDPSKEYAD